MGLDFHSTWVSKIVTGDIKTDVRVFSSVVLVIGKFESAAQLGLLASQRQSAQYGRRSQTVRPPHNHSCSGMGLQSLADRPSQQPVQR